MHFSVPDVAVLLHLLCPQITSALPWATRKAFSSSMSPKTVRSTLRRASSSPCVDTRAPPSSSRRPSSPRLCSPSSEIVRVGDNKKVHHIDLIPQEQLLAVISGRNRHVRLFPTQALDGRETESYKLAETKGCQTIVSGPVRNGSLTCLCVAMKRQIICYEVRAPRPSVWVVEPRSQPKRWRNSREFTRLTICGFTFLLRGGGT